MARVELDPESVAAELDAFRARSARLLAAAQESGLPVVGITETMPEGASYVGWMLDQLDATEKALSAPSS